MEPHSPKKIRRFEKITIKTDRARRPQIETVASNATTFGEVMGFPPGPLDNIPAVYWPALICQLPETTMYSGKMFMEIDGTEKSMDIDVIAGPKWSSKTGFTMVSVPATSELPETHMVCPPHRLSRRSPLWKEIEDRQNRVSLYDLEDLVLLNKQVDIPMEQISSLPDTKDLLEKIGLSHLVDGVILLSGNSQYLMAKLVVTTPIAPSPGFSISVFARIGGALLHNFTYWMGMMRRVYGHMAVYREHELRWPETSQRGLNDRFVVASADIVMDMFARYGHLLPRKTT